MKRIVLFLGVFLVPGLIQAGEPTCHTSTAAPYCYYLGKVKQLYINDSGVMLLYFDTPMASGAPASVGIGGVSKFVAGAVSYKDKPEFASYFYSTALAAQTTDNDVKIQMRGTVGGYLKIDRIWVD
ncbi:hypothetical protein ACRYJU_06925 [Alloalcanivorax xenomutans]|uniref:hypothetical protein n=1 Tax=Alloalcanivorax xenomutans TaxID=1094342 RepID=UPI00047AA16F|nr:hypothetical protein [Alcanivorax sp.]